ncbi:MAG TPA: hotdog domain-containing protein [Nakamurella sp.]
MRHEVTDNDTAEALGSGDVQVLGTPRLIAWMEAASVREAAAFIGPGQTTVGTAIRIEHRRPTAVGGTVVVTASPRENAGRRLTFDVRAIDGSAQIVAAGEIDRVIVDRDRFLAAAADADAQ